MYDLVSGRQLVKSSYLVGRQKALELFPMLKKEKLCGAIIYYDGELLANHMWTMPVENNNAIILHEW